ncbi:alpha/beta fold hydrolase [Streptomyces griseocarneus]|uniref:alpha/beta fold hydrolase n=1 Tax=Streptomyces griseocarneus TaxID=51201 RepID=UPI00167C97EC|nr:alpha/beta hydrolase [Streptomyces griseocarneus]MBZ6475202.1 alpha/beta hydrolase [Streptomyces griseocarneus]GHG61688.1 alpha/beta hydrolase [Streptomyces griseocarneus]
MTTENPAALGAAFLSAAPARRPTIVLVHGAFADATSWQPVIERLQADGYTVIAPANPLRGLRHDAAHLAARLAAVEGPVVLAGHSYGGAVITEAAASTPNVHALVYVAAFMPDAGEVLGELSERFPGSHLVPALTPVTVPGTDATEAVDLYIEADRFPDVFAHDVPHETARTLATVQRPVSATAFGDAPTAAPWRHLPTWALIATEDRGIAPDLQRFQADRAGAHRVEVPSSHLPLHSHPDAVADLIRSAAGHRRADRERRPDTRTGEGTPG